MKFLHEDWIELVAGESKWNSQNWKLELGLVGKYLKISGSRGIKVELKSKITILNQENK